MNVNELNGALRRGGDCTRHEETLPKNGKNAYNKDNYMYLFCVKIPCGDGASRSGVVQKRRRLYKTAYGFPAWRRYRYGTVKLHTIFKKERRLYYEVLKEKNA